MYPTIKNVSQIQHLHPFFSPSRTAVFVRWHGADEETRINEWWRFWAATSAQGKQTLTGYVIGLCIIVNSLKFVFLRFSDCYCDSGMISGTWHCITVCQITTYYFVCYICMMQNTLMYYLFDSSVSGRQLFLKKIFIMICSCGFFIILYFKKYFKIRIWYLVFDILRRKYLVFWYLKYFL